MVAGQNLYSLTSSPEFQQLLFQQLQEGHRQLKEEFAILKDELELKELKARIAILEGRLRILGTMNWGATDMSKKYKRYHCFAFPCISLANYSA